LEVYRQEVRGRGRHYNFKMIMSAMTAPAILYAMHGYEVIVDFSIPPWLLDTARRIAKSKDVVRTSVSRNS
jgi:hypothetical protein